MDPREQPTQPQAPNEPQQQPTGYPQQQQMPVNQQPVTTPEPQLTVPAFDAPAPEVPLRKSHKKLALVLLIGPSALLLGSMLLYAIVNFMFSASSGDGALYGDQSFLQAASNVVMFLIGIVGVVTWLPGIIIGIILLARKK